MFGHKPSAGIVSTGGTFPSTKGYDRLDSLVGIGPISRFSEDLLPALQVMADEKADLLRLEEPVDVTQLKVFYQNHDGGSPFCSQVEPDILAAIDRAVNHFKKITKTQAPQETNIEYVKDNFKIIAQRYREVELASLISNGKGINRILEFVKCIFGWSRHTLQSICVIDIFPGKPAVFDQQLNDKEKELRAQFETMLGSSSVFLFPMMPTVALYHSETIISMRNVSYTAIVNLLGLPSTVVPMGIGREGLPVSLQVIAGRNQDRLCLAVAKELESAFGGWVEPGTTLVSSF